MDESATRERKKSVSYSPESTHTDTVFVSTFPLGIAEVTGNVQWSWIFQKRVSKKKKVEQHVSRLFLKWVTVNGSVCY